MRNASNTSDWYAILQVHESAEPEVIEAAYNRLARKYHPDVNSSPNATVMMQRLNDAYAILGDPLNRHRGNKSDRQRPQSRRGNPGGPQSLVFWCSSW